MRCTTLSRAAPSGDSLETCSCLLGIRTLARSTLISLIIRAFSATSCINRSRSVETFVASSSLDWVSTLGPCLHPLTTSRAKASPVPVAATRLRLNIVKYSRALGPFCQELRDVRHAVSGCRVGALGRRLRIDWGLLYPSNTRRFVLECGAGRVPAA